MDFFTSLDDWALACTYISEVNWVLKLSVKLRCVYFPFVDFLQDGVIVNFNCFGAWD